MFSYSNFEDPTYKPTRSSAYKVLLNGEEIPVYTCRISAYPFNTWWPGHQRPVDQTVVVSYVNIVSDEEIKLDVTPLFDNYEKVMLKPYSKGVIPTQENGAISFSLKENGAYVLELDHYHNTLYIFNNRPVECECPEEVTHYFGAGIHIPGRITLKSNESIYIDKDALVYGCVFAENAENIRIYGNGIFDDSGEERFSQHCTETYPTGNMKLINCKNVSVEGVGFTNSAIWCVNVYHCFDVKLDGIKVFGEWRYNTDGIDVVNSQRVEIRNSFVHSFDDCIVIKGLDKYCQTSNKDMLIEHCVLWCDWGNTCEIGLETSCEEYENIIFRDCDLLRAGHTACDIQNGDSAKMHNITFEDIRMELESFYTPHIYQKTQTQKYTATNETEIARVLSINNPRFREMYSFLHDFEEIPIKPDDPRDFASSHDITVRGVKVYCDEKILAEKGTKCVSVEVRNLIPTTEYSNITVEDITLNGKPMSIEDIHTRVRRDGRIENVNVLGASI